LELERQQAKTRASIIIGILAVLGVITISGLAWFAIKRRRDLLFERQMNHITQLKLTSTRNRVSPHFFFNALGSLKNMADEPEQFQQKLNDLSILMRKTIENIDQVAIPLCEELDIVKAYTELYRHKMDGNLDFQINIEEGIDLNTLIPSMIIQIPVENAIKHGLMQSGRVDKKLYITIKSSEGFILIRITNNGLPLSETIGKSTSTGTGLKTITQSIHLLNANNQQKIYFDLLEWEDKETVTEIKIPKTYNYQLNLN
jgi:LytS/YehU family sensor histidine kinase